MIRLVKGVLGGLLICACVSACSDDTMEGEGNEGLKENAVPAYLNVSFKASSAVEGRSVDSRTDTEANTGDSHGNAENSGHTDKGIEAEYQVKTALVIAHPTTTNVAFAKLYSVTPTLIPDDKAETDNKHFYVSETGITSTLDGTTPIELAVGEYKLLVVVNPPQGDNGLISAGFTYTTSLTEVKALYEKALDGNYYVVEETNYLAGPAAGNDAKGFMMANKEEKTVSLAATNTPDNPAHVQITVERAASKIAYRQMKTDNKYEVTIETELKYETIDGAVPGATEGSWIYVEELYKATYVDANEEEQDIVVWYQTTTGEDGTETTAMTAYKRTDNKITLTIGEGESEETVETYKCEKVEGEISEDDIQLSFDAAQSTRSKYDVQIIGYALTNLSKSVNYVRHTVEYSSLYGVPFGTVEDKYLWTPNWEAKNSVDFTAEDFATKAEGWYYNPLHKVAEVSKTLTFTNGTFSDATYFAAMPKQDNGEAHDNNAQTVPAVGATLGYCLENSTDIDHQTHGLSTGIVFVATITKQGEETPADLYKYNGYVYESLEAIVKAYGKSHFEEGFFNLTANSSDVELAEYDVVRYKNGVCYFYTSEIKHFDNGDNSKMGYMEYAIMRNNIYSIAIKDIRFIGDPYLEPTPGTPNESGKTALDIEVQIVPWIVRYNDIEF